MKEDMSFMQKGEFGKLHPFFQYFYNLGVLGSQAISTVLGGDPDETLSSRTGKAVLGGNKFCTYVLAPFLDALFFDPNHTMNSIEFDEGKKEIWHWSDYQKKLKLKKQ